MQPDSLPPYVILDKQVGETPLSCAEAWRAQAGVDPGVPLTYAGRLDPMASGKLLVLIGDECKKKDEYLGLDKAYDFSVLLGIGSDTHDVLGLLTTAADETTVPTPEMRPAGKGWGDAFQKQECPFHISTKPNANTSYPHQAIGQNSSKQHPPKHAAQRAVWKGSGLELAITKTTSELEGEINLPYPHFSSKTVQGKPLHMWTLENRLDEIDIPTKQSTIYSLELTNIEIKTRTEVCDDALTKIDTIPPVTETRKALGNDFRRADVRKDWEQIKNDDTLPDHYHIAHFHCIASSGTYMRTLAKVIGQKLNTHGLAWHIHRIHIGNYDPIAQNWTKTYY